MLIIGFIFDVIVKDFIFCCWFLEFCFVNYYYDCDNFIIVLVNKVKMYWEIYGRVDKFILFYYGIFKCYLMNGDFYYCECYKMLCLFVEKFGFLYDEYMIIF